MSLKMDSAATEAQGTQPVSSRELPTPCFGGQKYSVLTVQWEEMVSSLAFLSFFFSF